MISIIAPAKIFNRRNLQKEKEIQELKFQKYTEELINILKEYTVEDLSDLMKISQEIAEVNNERFNKFNEEERYSAIGLFYGEVYKAINAIDLTSEELEFADENIRILSGLYGIISPLDRINEYRLEMGTKLKNSKGNNLYNFWKDELTKNILELLKNTKGDKVLINIASKEYSKVLDMKQIEKSYNVINIDFKVKKEDKYKVIGMYAKKARGLMINYIIKNKINKTEELKNFNIDGYEFNKVLSTEKDFIFTKNM